MKVARCFQLLSFFPIYLIVKACFGFEIYGRDNLEGLSPRDAVIYAANHCSPFDGVITAVALAMPLNGFRFGAFLPIRYLAFEEYFSWLKFDGPFPFPLSAIVAAWLRLSDCIPVKSRRKDQLGKVYVEDVLSSAITSLRKGERVFIFPEGKMSKNGKIQKAKRGVACLHKETLAPIVPIHIDGTFCMFSWKNLISARKKVVVSFGVPFAVPVREDHQLADMAVGAELVMKKIERIGDIKYQNTDFSYSC